MSNELKEFFAAFSRLVAYVEPLLTADACIDRLNRKTRKTDASSD